MLHILYTGISYPVPLIGILMAFHWQGNLHFCLVKDNKYSVYQNTGFLVIYVNLAYRWKRRWFSLSSIKIYILLEILF